MLREVGHVLVKHAGQLTVLHVTSSPVYSSTDHIFHDSISSPHLRDNLDEKTYSSCQKYVYVTELRFFKIRLDWQIAHTNYENMLMDADGFRNSAVSSVWNIIKFYVWSLLRG